MPRTNDARRLGRIPERLDRVEIPLSRLTVVLPWASRDALLEQDRRLDSMQPVRAGFEAVGASRPAQIPQTHKGPLAGVIDFWMNQVTVAGLPKEILELRNALIDHVHDAQHRAARGESR